MTHAVIIDGSPKPFTGRFVTDADGVQHPLKPMSAEQKRAFGIYEVTVETAMPTGHVAAGRRWVLEGDRVIDRPVLERASDANLIRGIKAEANRRILAIVPEWKQRNLLAQAAQLAKRGETHWTADDHAAWEDGETIWERVSAIRAASDDLEAMDPLPTDYDDDRHWP
jgi:hypothetical protein